MPTHSVTRLDPDAYELLEKLAKEEERPKKTVASRAVRDYAKRQSRRRRSGLPMS